MSKGCCLEINDDGGGGGGADKEEGRKMNAHSCCHQLGSVVFCDASIQVFAG